MVKATRLQETSNANKKGDKGHYFVNKSFME